MFTESYQVAASPMDHTALVWEVGGLWETLLEYERVLMKEDFQIHDPCLQLCQVWWPPSCEAGAPLEEPAVTHEAATACYKYSPQTPNSLSPVSILAQVTPHTSIIN